MEHEKKYKTTMKLFIFSIIVFILFNIHNSPISTNRTITSQGLSVKKYLGLEKTKYSNYSGKSITVGIIDSGISPHNDINNGRILAFKDFTFMNQAVPYDDNGHGTFIAGIIGANGTLKGIAPDVNFVIVKALDYEGKCDFYTLKQALDWVLINACTYNIRILNISFGYTPSLTKDNDEICKILREIKKKNIAIICSSGNGSIMLSPGISPDVITIGSCNNNHTYCYSDDSPASFCTYKSELNNISKPDLYTFGLDILSLDYRQKDKYVQKSGSSFSTGIVSGIMAVLMEKYNNKSLSFLEEYLYKNSVYPSRNHKIKVLRFK